MINFWRDKKEDNTSIEEAEKTLERCKLSLTEAAMGTKTAALDLITDLKSAVESREKKYQILVENIQDGMYILRNRKFIFVNRALCDHIGLPRHEILGKTLKEVVDVTANYSDMISGAGAGHREYTIRYKQKNTGTKKVVTVWETLSYDKEFALLMGCEGDEVENNECAIAIGTVKDVTDAEEKERMLRAFSSAINDSSDVIIVISYPGDIMFVNTAFEETYGYTLDEVAGRNPRILKSGLHEEEFYRRMWLTLLSGQEWRGVVFNKAKDGRIVEDDTKIFPFMNGKSVPMFFMAVKKVRRFYTSAEAVEILGWNVGNKANP